MQASLGLGHDRLALVQLRQGQENGRQVAERFVQPARLRRVGSEQPHGLEPVEHGMPRFVRHDVERAAGIDAPVAAAGDEVAKAQALLGAAVERIHHIGQAVRKQLQCRGIAAAIPLPRQRRRTGVGRQRTLVHRQCLAHDGKGVHGVELVGLGLHDEVAEGVRADRGNAGRTGRDARIARSRQHDARQVGLAGADFGHRRVLLPDQHPGAKREWQRNRHRPRRRAAADGRPPRLVDDGGGLAVLAESRRRRGHIADGRGGEVADNVLDRH